MPANEYKPSMPAERVARLRRWHEEVSAELHQLGAHDVDYLGLDLHVPEHVFGPTPTSDLLGRAVLARVRDGHRVLDMGCGTGANAILAARTSSDVSGRVTFRPSLAGEGCCVAGRGLRPRSGW